MNRQHLIDLVGKMFGRLTVINRAENGARGQPRWNCLCACGGKTVSYGQTLRLGKARSCGCLRPGVITSKRARSELTQTRLRELLDYDPTTGIFTWKVTSSQTAIVGDRAGTIDVHGYRAIGIDGNRHRAGRIAWMYVHGSMPKNFIDHRNGVRDDDRIENLREATKNENARNSKSKHQTLGRMKGAYQDKTNLSRRWFSSIRVYRKQIYLGTFDSEAEAHAAYAAAAAKYHGEFARPA